MPIVKHAWEGEAPKEPHLALITGVNEGMAIPVGAVICIVENPSKLAGGVIPLILERVSKTRLSFRCACGNKQCTRDVRFEAKWRGHHPARY